jgi:ribose 5-phosphate isomerase RpiB
LRVAIGADHAGFALKERLKRELQTLGHEVADVGTDSDRPVDYPDFCFPVGELVASGVPSGNRARRQRDWRVHRREQVRGIARRS